MDAQLADRDAGRDRLLRRLHEDQNSIPIPKRTIASAKQARRLETPEGGVRPFTFRLEVQPVLDRNCVSCHNGKNAEPDFRKDQMVTYKRGILTKINKQYDQSYLNLHPYVYRQGPESDIYVLKPAEFHASNSELIRILQAGHHGVEFRKRICERSMPGSISTRLIMGLSPK